MERATSDTHVNRVGIAHIRGEFSLIAAEAIAPGERIYWLDGELSSQPSRYSVQVGERQHVDFPPGVDPERHLDRYLWRFLNHSCEPNARIRGRELFALRAIHPGEEVTFDYNTTEYEIACPFTCRCGSCDGAKIRGFKHLSTSERIRLAPLLANHINRHLVSRPAQIR